MPRQRRDVERQKNSTDAIVGSVSAAIERLTLEWFSVAGWVAAQQCDKMAKLCYQNLPITYKNEHFTNGLKLATES